MQLSSQNAFNRNGHVDVLDLVCVQCEPDSADYIRVGFQQRTIILNSVFVFSILQQDHLHQCNNKSKGKKGGKNDQLELPNAAICAI